MALPDLDDLIAEVDRRCTTANTGAREQPDWIELLKAAARISGELQSLGDELVEEYIEHCRLHGCSWADVGDALGVTRQAVQQRFRSPHREYPADEFADELRAAMTVMKQAAVQHRNNFIGTEHLLWGLTATDNTATAALAALGVSVAELRVALEDRLELGASQAAQRIAWTPYSRRAMALARERATSRDSGVIQCHDVLVGLARLGRGIAAKVLADAGADAGSLDAVTTS